MNRNTDKDVTIFAETNFRNERVKFGIKIDDRRKHTYAIGKTGMGKTVMLENMAIEEDWLLLILMVSQLTDYFILFPRKEWMM